MSYKRMSGMENYGTLNNVHSRLLEISSEVELDEEEEEEEELEFKKPRKSPVIIFKYLGATICLIAMVLSCECLHIHVSYTYGV